MRERIYELVEQPDSADADWYDILSIILTIAGIVPLAFKGTNQVFAAVEALVTVFFTIDYILRWATADIKAGKSGFRPFLQHPFTFSAVLDLLSLLPGYFAVNQGLRLLRAARLVRLLKMTRVFRAMRYSSSLMLIGRVLRRQQDSLKAVSALAIAYVLVSALIIFNVEPDSFGSFFDAIYWATVSLTTVGYGDIYPVTTIGRIVTMVSSVFGIAVVALPASIITAGFMEELQAKIDTRQSSRSVSS